jgi:hypothetical protein
MIKLNPEHIHLFLDEPIYVLHEHFESTLNQNTIEEDESIYQVHKGENNKGIIIFNEDENSELISPEDEEFLLKGLNALDIFLEDILIIDSEESLNKLEYSKIIKFTSNPDPATLYKVTSRDQIQYLECDKISTIKPNVELQKKFWIGLKTLFGRLN